MSAFAPRAYQRRAIEFVRRTPGCLLAIEMGLGKTVITLTAMAGLLGTCDVRRVLVIAPKRVAEHTWPDEVAKWPHLRHLRIARVLGSVRQRERALASAADLYLTNRENVVWLVKHYGRKAWPFDAVVIDESTSFKDGGTQRHRALRRVRGQIERMVLLTGTPAPNTYLDLWAQMWLVDAGARLGRTFTGFKQRWFESDYMGYSWTERPGARAEIEAAIADVTLSLRAEDWLQLPPQIVVDVPVALPASARAAYRALERDGLAELAGTEITAPSAAAVANKLAQAANGALYDEDGRAHALHDAKLDALDELVEAAAAPVLVAYRFRADVERIRARYPEAREARDPGALDAWNAGKLPLLLVHPASAGYGLNLQAGGRRLVWFGPPWSLEQYLQTNARLHRQGQQHTVIVHRLVAAGTLDEHILGVLAGKHEGLTGLMRALADGAHLPQRSAA